jgi:O-antigen ligase
VTSFGYANQAGGFFVLCFCIAIGVMLSTLLHRQPVRTKVWPVLCSLILLGGLLVSLSRSAIILSLILLALTALYVLTYRMGQTSRAKQFNRLIAILAIGTATFLAIYPLVGDSVVDELARQNSEALDLCLPASWTHSALENIRPMYRAIAVKVLRDNFWFGAGGWAVRHLGIIYVPLSQIPRLQTEGAANTHNDTLQFLSEFGVLGMALLWGGIGVIATPLVRHWRTLWNSPRSVFNILGLLAITIHSNFDSPFRSPAILFLWILVLGLTAQDVASSCKRRA